MPRSSAPVLAALLVLACRTSDPDGEPSDTVPSDTGTTSPPPLVEVRVDGSLAPVVDEIDGWTIDTTRRVTCASDVDGLVGSFVADEIVARIVDPKDAVELLSRTNGQVVATIGDDLQVVRVDLSTADRAGFAEDVQGFVYPKDGIEITFCDEDGWSLAAIAAAERARGLTVDLDWVGEPTAYLDGATAEATAFAKGGSDWGVPYTPDAYAWPHLADVVDVWTMLAVHGSTPVGAAVLDRGFSTVGELAGVTVSSGYPYDAVDGRNPAGDWHAQSVASSLFAPVDDGIGGAGIAGPVADPHLVYAGPDLASLTGGLVAARDRGDRVAVAPLAVEVPQSFAWSITGVESVWQELAADLVVVAPTSNRLWTKDAEGPDVVAPCHFDDVVCAAPLDVEGRPPPGFVHPKDVVAFAPGVHWVGSGPDGSADEVREVRGASYAAAYVAGTAALMLAAVPEQTPDDVRSAPIRTPREVFTERYRWTLFSGLVDGGQRSDELPFGLAASGRAEVDVVTLTSVVTSAAVSADVLSPDGEVLSTRNWVSARDQEVFRGFVALGTLDPTWRPTTLQLESQVGWFRYGVLFRVQDRAGYNVAGTDLASARDVMAGDTVRGSLRGEESGHTYALTLNPGATVTVDGTFTADPQTGTNVRIDVYDDDDVLVEGPLFRSVPYGTVTDSGQFPNDTGAPVRFVFHVVNEIGGARWELLDYAITFSVAP